MRTDPFQSILTDSRRGRPEFLDRCRAPALIIEGVSGKHPIERTPYPPMRRSTRTRLPPATQVVEPLDPQFADAAIVWIEKSPRNTFTQIVTLGRAPENDLRFDLEELSTIHATFARSGVRWFIQDHFSRNGTTVNGEPLGPGALRRLVDGDTIRFGQVLGTRFFGPQGLYDFLSLVHRNAASKQAQG